MIYHFNNYYLILEVNTFLYKTALHTIKKPVFQYVNTGQCRNTNR